MGSNTSQWTARLAAALGVTPPSTADVDRILGLAGIAAHAAERTSAPLSAWLAGRAGVTPEEALAAAKRLAAELATGDDESRNRQGGSSSTDHGGSGDKS